MDMAPSMPEDKPAYTEPASASFKPSFKDDHFVPLSPHVPMIKHDSPAAPRKQDFGLSDTKPNTKLRSAIVDNCVFKKLIFDDHDNMGNAATKSIETSRVEEVLQQHAAALAENVEF